MARVCVARGELRFGGFVEVARRVFHNLLLLLAYVYRERVENEGTYKLCLAPSIHIVCHELLSRMLLLQSLLCVAALHRQLV